ncbi:MAG: hypothetical protein R3D25_13005 [Geminicoccaceae bacterium]
MTRRLLARCLGSGEGGTCHVLGPGRLVCEGSLPFPCRMDPLPGATDWRGLEPGCRWLVIGDGLASLDDPQAALARIARGLASLPATRILMVLPGTAMLPDDEPPFPRRWLFSAVSGKAMAGAAFGDRIRLLASLGNALTASAELLGLAADRLWPDELERNDPEYPMVVAFATVD